MCSYTEKKKLGLQNAGAFEFTKKLKERVTNAGLKTKESDDKAFSSGGNGHLGFDILLNNNDIVFQLVITKKKNIKVQVFTYTMSAKEKLGLELTSKNYGKYYTIESLEVVHKHPDTVINFLLEMDKKLQQ